MAITKIHAELLRSLEIPRGSTLLEIGEANWYGDCDPADYRLTPQDNQFATAKEFYAKTFEPSVTKAIDMSGTPEALRLDLNSPIDLADTFDVVINHGTAEHIFNIAQVFQTIHERCDISGYMVHDAPFTGWIDHGFYCLQPTLFYDLATANNYEVQRVFVTQINPPLAIRIESRDHVAVLAEQKKIPANSNLFVVLRKRFDKPFRIPQQGYYANHLSRAGSEAWSKLR